jgi:glycine/D-amino acid oxidase-like deaminating enzyme
MASARTQTLAGQRPRSLWLQEALARPGEKDAPALQGEARADVCIVGGGYTGLWTALRLKELEPSLDVAIVEADVCGGGASGRNGGLVLSLWSKFPRLQETWGTEGALALGRASAGAVTAIGEECRRRGIDAEFREDGYLWAATNEAGAGSWRHTLDALDRAGVSPFEEWTPEQASARAGSTMHRGGVFEPSGAVVQPALLARGLRREAMAADVAVFERSAMTGLRRAGASGWKVVTAGGAVTAGTVVVAMNAWAVWFRQVRRHVLVLGSDVLATPPIPERLAEIGYRDGLGVSDSHLLVHYYRNTGDGRFVFGKGGGEVAGRLVDARFEGASRRLAEVTGQFRRIYPNLADVPVELSWTGPIDRTMLGLPYFGPLGGRQDVLIGVGYSGNGVGPSYLGGRILASLVLHRDDEWAGSPLAGGPRGWFLPAPLRQIGGRMVRAAIARTEDREDAGRPPRALDRALVSLAPSGLALHHGD